MTRIGLFIGLVLMLLAPLASFACNKGNTTCGHARVLDINDFNAELCLMSCNEGGTNENYRSTNQGCEGSPFYTVWYEIQLPSSDGYLSLEINSSELNTPMLTLYSGSCSSLTLVSCNQGYDYRTSIEKQKVSNTTYYLAVSDAQKIEGSFELCVLLDENKNKCNKNSALTVVGASQGSSLEGPYKPGEQIDFCYNIDGFENVGCNYLHTVIPIFGNGWDPSSFEADGQPKLISQHLEAQGRTSFTTANPICEGEAGGKWDWYGENTVSYNLNSENPLGLTSNDFIPPSWVFLNSFDPSCFEMTDACCTNPTSDPNLGYGDDNYPVCGQGKNLSWTICFSLIAAINPDENNHDCSLMMKTTGDGETGDLIGKDCKFDQGSLHPASVEVCTAPIISISSASLKVCPSERFTIELGSDQNNTAYWSESLGENQILENNTYSYQYSEPGTYTINFQGSNGCKSNIVTLQVEVVDELEIALEQTPAMACVNEPVDILVNLPAGIDASQLVYNWNQAGLSGQSATSVSDPNISYGVEVSYFGCTTLAEISINTFESSEVLLRGEENVCAGGIAHLYLDFVGEGPWEVVLEDAYSNQMTIISDQTNFIQEVTSEDNTYKMVQATDANGCIMSMVGEATIEPLAEFIVSGGADLKLGCAILEVELEASMDVSLENYLIQWTADDNQAIENDQTMHPTVSEPGIYSIEITDILSGCTGTDTVIVSEHVMLLDVELTQTLFEIEAGELINLSAQVSIPESEIQLVQWEHDGSIACDTCLASIAKPLESTTFHLHVEDMFGCEQIVTVEVIVRTSSEDTGEEIPTNKFYIPNTFNPAAENENNTFLIFDNGSIESIESFQIFDRWGNLVHNVSDLPISDYQGWDGSYNSSRVSAGVFVYKLSLSMKNGEKLRLFDNLTVLY